MISRKAFLAAIGASIVVAALAIAADSADELKGDVQLRAMLDELIRSRTLQLNNLDKPYFIQYTISDSHTIYAGASLGGLTSVSDVRLRQPRGVVRVGDYKFDNTNSVFTSNPRTGLLTIDDDYDALRNQLWLSTDWYYKAAAEQIARKRAAMIEVADSDKTPDFAPAKPILAIQEPSKLKLDAKQWQEIARQISARFIAHPGIDISSVRFRAIGSTYRLVNTEGSIVRIPQELTEVDIRANGLAPDGTRIWNHRLIAVLRPEELPAQAELTSMTDNLAEETDALLNAPPGEEYSGPVLFENEAAGQLLAQVLSDAIHLERTPIQPSSDRRGERRDDRRDEGQRVESVWAAKVNGRVAPEWLTVVDDAKQKTFEGKPLAGYFEVDDEGVPAQAVTVVDKGIFKNFLLSRLPVRSYNESNGHGRLPGSYGSEKAVIGNLFVKVGNGISDQELRANLLEKVKAAGLKYGIIVRRLDFPSTANIQELQSLARQAQKNGYSRTLNAPLLIYRVYANGREELIRGMRFREFSARNLRDLEAAGNHAYVFNYVNNGNSFNLADTGGEATSSSVIAPSLLFDGVDLAPAEVEPGHLPLVPAPALSAQ